MNEWISDDTQKHVLCVSKDSKNPLKNEDRDAKIIILDMNSHIQGGPTYFCCGQRDLQEECLSLRSVSCLPLTMGLCSFKAVLWNQGA